MFLNFIPKNSIFYFVYSVYFDKRKIHIILITVKIKHIEIITINLIQCIIINSNIVTFHLANVICDTDILRILPFQFTKLLQRKLSHTVTFIFCVYTWKLIKLTSLYKHGSIVPTYDIACVWIRMSICVNTRYSSVT